jgi:DNA mismatch repair protein MLH3
VDASSVLVSGVPQPIRDCLNSKACRSAVMFGKSIDKTKAATLIKEVMGCKHPFQCAHGRPSLIPLLKLIDHSNTSTHPINWHKWVR